MPVSVYVDRLYFDVLIEFQSYLEITESHMKSDHRHDLKTNVLADWMTHIPEWSQRNAKSLIGGTAIVVLIVVAVFWSQYNNTVLAQAHRVKFTSDLANSEVLTMQVAQSSAQGEDMSITLGESSSNLGELAQDTSSKTMAALAYLKQAEMLREQTHFENGQPAEETVKSRMEAAITAYNMALEKGQTNKTLVSVAQYGLGLCAEELGKFDEAAKIYKALISDTSLDGTIGKASASHRLESMASFQDPITFPIVEQTAEVPAPPALPEIGPMLPDVNAAAPVVAPNAVPADVNTTE